MSTTFYGFTVSKDKFWDAVEELRTLVAAEYPYFVVILELIKNDASYDKLWKFIDMLTEHDKADIELQVFMLDGYDKVWVRVLENGWFVMNNQEELENFELFFVDDRTDSDGQWTEEDRRFVEDVLDPLITERKYFLVPIVDKEYYRRFLWDNRRISDGQKNSKK